MIIYRIPTSGREVLATIIARTSRGDIKVQPKSEPARWIPPDWIIESDEED
jgi:hypothetical protein